MTLHSKTSCCTKVYEGLFQTATTLGDIRCSDLRNRSILNGITNDALTELRSFHDGKLNVKRCIALMSQAVNLPRYLQDAELDHKHQAALASLSQVASEAYSALFELLDVIRTTSTR